LVVESAGGECVDLEFLIAEFAFCGWSYCLFEGLGRGAGEGACD
jgi:hypothetical protein